MRQLITGLVVLLVLSLTGGGIALYQAHSTPAQRSPLAVLTGHTTFVTSVAFSPDGHTLASASDNQPVRLWNVTDPTHPTSLEPTLTGHSSAVYAVAFSPDGHTLASGSFDQTVQLWNVP